jgi:hypothetical protein
MSDRNECTPGDFANSAALAADHAAQNALLVSTEAAVDAAAVNGRVNIQMARGSWVPVYPGEAMPFTANGRYVTPGPVVETDKQTAVIAIMRGDATLV